jgi:hypothetical protein
MPSFWATPANPHHQPRIHPALYSFADECCATLARLVAYVGTLVLFAIVGLYLWDQLPLHAAADPAVKAGWSPVTRSAAAFAVSQSDSSEKPEAYEIFRHPDGGRKDVLRWAAQDQDNGDHNRENNRQRPVAELEVYRPGAELSQSGPVLADLAARMDPKGGRDLQRAGVIDGKFGLVTLLRAVDEADGARACLGFIKRLEEPALQISGWACQGDTWPARRAAIGCMLDRLILLTSGNEPKLAETFARAELKRAGCTAAISAASSDWVTAAENPRLRGPL